MLRQCKNNATSQNENPNIINRPQLKLDTEDRDENVKKNNLFQNPLEKSPLLEQHANFLKKTRCGTTEHDQMPLLLKSVNCD